MSFKVICAIAALAIPLFSFSQAQMKLPSVTVADLEEVSYPLDPEASAAILYDMGSSKTSDRKVMITHHKLRRIKIYSKDGLTWANWSLGLYKTKTRNETLKSFRASVYNLENGRVSQRILSEKDLIDEEYSDEYSVIKLTFPKAKEGSILELEYTLESDYLFEFGWEFQQAIPVKWSEYSASVHDYYKFNFLLRNYFPVEKLGLAHWRTLNLPAFRDEKFITTRDDLITTIMFNMTSAQFPDQYSPVFQVGNWKDMKSLIRDEWDKWNFAGKDIESYLASRFNDVEVTEVGAGQIFNRLRQDFLWDETHVLYPSTSFRKILGKRTGTNADLNLFLYKVLEEKGFKPQIHITSTLDHGRAKYDVPVINKFNHLLSRVVVDDMVLWLDLTSAGDAYDLVPTKLLGTDALEMNTSETPLWRKIETTKAKNERSAAIIRLDMEEERVRVKYNLIASDYLKQDVLNRELGQRLKLIGVDYGEEYEIDSLRLELADGSMKPLVLNCEYSKGFEKAGDLIVVNPLLVEARVESPFGNDEMRYYPIHFEHKVITNYRATIIIPNGYSVDTLPGSVQIKLEGNLGQFRYILVKSGNQVQVLLNYTMNEVDIAPDVFPALKEFYSKITESISQSIVIKKNG